MGTVIESCKYRIQQEMTSMTIEFDKQDINYYQILDLSFTSWFEILYVNHFRLTVTKFDPVIITLETRQLDYLSNKSVHVCCIQIPQSNRHMNIALEIFTTLSFRVKKILYLYYYFSITFDYHKNYYYS